MEVLIREPGGGGERFTTKREPERGIKKG